MVEQVAQQPSEPTRHTLTDLVSLLRYHRRRRRRAGPYADRVQERYAAWLAQQEQAGATFTQIERWWLDRMVDVIASSAGITADDLDEAPFTERGGVDGALRDLGDRAGRSARRAERGAHRVSWQRGWLGDVATVVDCEHRTAPRAEVEAFGFSIGTRDVRKGRISLRPSQAGIARDLRAVGRGGRCRIQAT